VIFLTTDPNMHVLPRHETHIQYCSAQLIDCLLSNNLITKHQHGFLLKHTTCTNLLKTINDWVLALDNRLKTDGIYIDFDKLDCSIELYADDAELYSLFKVEYFPALVEFLEYKIKGVKKR